MRVQIVVIYLHGVGLPATCCSVGEDGCIETSENTGDQIANLSMKNTVQSIFLAEEGIQLVALVPAEDSDRQEEGRGETSDGCHGSTQNPQEVRRVPRPLILDVNGDFFAGPAVGVGVDDRDAGDRSLVLGFELRREKRAYPHDHPDLGGGVGADWPRSRQRSRRGGRRCHRRRSRGRPGSGRAPARRRTRIRRRTGEEILERREGRGDWETTVSRHSWIQNDSETETVRIRKWRPDPLSPRRIHSSRPSNNHPPPGRPPRPPRGETSTLLGAT